MEEKLGLLGTPPELSTRNAADSSLLESHRVAVIYHYFSHYRAGIIQELAHESHNKYVFFSDQEDTRNDGIITYEFPTEIRHIALRNSRLGGAWIWQHGLVRVALSRKYDTLLFLGDVHCLSTWVAAWCARRIGRKRIIYWTIGWHRPESGFIDWARCRFYHIAHALLLYGQYGRQMAIKKGFDPETCYVVLNSLDWRRQLKLRCTPNETEINATRVALGVDPTVPMVICVSRLTAKRQLELLLDAAVLLKGQGIRISIVLVGEGVERDRLQWLAKKSELDVVFTGAIYDETKLARVIQAANVTVCPGMAGLTAIQSLTYGTPVITHDDADYQAPESEAILPGVTGELFKRNDAASLVAAIMRACTAPMPSNASRAQCYRMIDEKFNPVYQRYVIDRAIDGLNSSETTYAAEQAMQTGTLSKES